MRKQFIGWALIDEDQEISVDYNLCIYETRADARFEKGLHEKVVKVKIIPILED